MVIIEFMLPDLKLFHFHRFKIMTQKQTKLNTDLLISGAGPAGIVAAMFLAKAGIKALVADKHTFPRDKICGDALSGKVVDVLKKLDGNIVDELALQPAQVGSWGVTFIAPNMKKLRVPFRKPGALTGTPPGFISKRLDFDDFLVRYAKTHYGIDVLENTALTHFEKTSDGWFCANAERDFEVQTRLLIVADGAQSHFARHHAGMEMEPEHYCAGIRAYYSGVKNMDTENFIELYFLNDLLPGYFWIFPLPDGRTNVGLGMRSDIVSRKKINLKEMLPRIIEKYPELKARFQDAVLEGKIAGFGLPLGSKKRSISGDGYLLTGDAASLIDPFTGEGIGNAMFSGMFAAEQAMKCLQENQFNAEFLKQYDARVYARLWKELSLSRKLQQLTTYPWLFNFVVNKAVSNTALSEMISCMFTDMELRKRLKEPSFYLNLLFTK